VLLILVLAVLCVAAGGGAAVAGDAVVALFSAANAALASRKEPAMPAVTYFANMVSLPDRN
jgi:hypothetical protein